MSELDRYVLHIVVITRWTCQLVELDEYTLRAGFVLTRCICQLVEIDLYVLQTVVLKNGHAIWLY